MAKDAKAAEGGEAAPPKKSKKLLIIRNFNGFAPKLAYIADSLSQY